MRTLSLSISLIVAWADEYHKQTGQWPRQANLPLRGRTLGIAGLGRIGKAVAIRGAAFGMRLLAYEPFPDQGFVDQHRIGLLPLEGLLAESRDLLTLVTGRDAPPLNGLVGELSERHPGLEIDVQDGGQPHYPLLLSAE